MTDTRRIAAVKALQERSRKDAEKYFYGTESSDDFLLRDPKSLPRFGHLARKAMMHYGREKYNPHEHGLIHEIFLRRIFRDVIAHKILYRGKGYDWEYIDNMLRRYIGGQLGINHTYVEARLEKGYIINGQRLSDIYGPGTLN